MRVLKKSLPVIIFDIVAFISFYLAFIFGSKGPCNGGLEALMVLLIAGLISAILLAYYIITGFVRHQKINFMVALIHLVAWGIFIGIVFSH
jgi:hypothetical protein